MPEHEQHSARAGGAFHLTFGARMRAYLFTGILITAPISITFYVSWLFINFIDDIVDAVIPEAYQPDHYLPFNIPGLGLLILLLFLLLVGMASAGIAGRFFVRIGEAVVNRMPVIRSIYNATKQIFETVLAQQSNAFREVVLIEFPRRDCWTIAFITGSTSGEVRRRLGEDTVSVFVPTTPNPTSGYLMIVPRQDLIVLDMTIEDALKLVISGGLVSPPDPQVSPTTEVAPTV